MYLFIFLFIILSHSTVFSLLLHINMHLMDTTSYLYAKCIAT